MNVAALLERASLAAGGAERNNKRLRGARDGVPPSPPRPCGDTGELLVPSLPSQAPVPVPPPRTGAARPRHPPPVWLCPVGTTEPTSASPWVSPQLSPRLGLAVSPLYCDGSQTWLRPTKLMSPRVPSAVPVFVWGQTCSGDPPSPTPELPWGPRGTQREPLGAVTAPQPPAAAPRVPVTTKENISGWKLREGRHGNTAAAGFHQNPGVRAQKDAQSPLCPAQTPPGLGPGEGERGMG